ncbi:MAG: competence protein CoiA [Chlamydiales bacterium]
MMQFYALNNKGQAISAKQAQKHCNYLCIECGTRVRLRGGMHRQRHFYHLEAVRSCSLRQKGMVHLQLQDYLFNLLPENDSVLEKRFPSINRIADVAWFSQKIVFEIQCSPISALEISQRNQDYLREGWRVVWILHDQRYNQKHLTPAEITLQGHPHYFSNMNAQGEGMIYDQFEIVDKGMRQKRLGCLKIDLAQPKWIRMSEEITCTSWSAPTAVSRLNLCRRRLLDWPIHFSGDLIDLQDSAYLQAAVRLENEFCRLTNRREVKQWMKWGLQRLIIHPYRVIFRYFLEKACR